MEKKENQMNGEVHTCGILPPPQPIFDDDISIERMDAVLSHGRKWVNFTHLHYYLFDGLPFGGLTEEKEVVRQAFDVWKDVGIGLKFSEVDDIQDAEIRIGFMKGDGSWSTVGTDALSMGQSKRTMNFGWDITQPGRNGFDTALHEIGHALGLNHEHQNANAGIVWNEDAVYEHYKLTQDPPWDKAKTDRNILRKLSDDKVFGLKWDPNSIMHYSISAGLIDKPEKFRDGIRPELGLSDRDKALIQFFYPDEELDPDEMPKLKLLRSQFLTHEPGSQKDFLVIPEASRTYTFSTFGDADTVMVLFEDVGGDFEYVKGDDDNGFNRNATFKVRLFKGRTYHLRVRFYNSESGDPAAVMMW